MSRHRESRNARSDEIRIPTYGKSGKWGHPSLLAQLRDIHIPSLPEHLYRECMPRTARSIVGGYVYHLINRGNGHARIFHDHADYRGFLRIVGEAQERVSVEIIAACLMPNHFHFVVRPRGDDDLAHWTHWLCTTHVRRHHKRYGTSGRVWQGRFKAFAIQQDSHLLTVLRYVERNPLRASLVERAEHWPWGSLRWRIQGGSPVELASPPGALPLNWIEYVNSPQTAAELESIRVCVNRQRPYGDQSWAERTAWDLGMAQTLRPVGRPRRRQSPMSDTAAE